MGMARVGVRRRERIVMDMVMDIVSDEVDSFVALLCCLRGFENEG